MILKIARVKRVSSEEISSDPILQRTLNEFGVRGSIPNLLGTLGATPPALAALAPWMIHLFRDATPLDPYTRELASLRIGWLCRSPYQFAQHVRAGLAAGLSDREIRNLKREPLAPGDWSPHDFAVLCACDEIYETHSISKTTWDALRCVFDQQQTMYICYNISQFMFLCPVLNTFGVQLDDGLTPDPDLC